MGFSSPESGFDSPWGHILCANFFRELIARSACVVALDQCVRSDCVVTLTIRPAPRCLRGPPPPTLRVRGGFRPMRTLRLRGGSHNPTSASRTRRSALAPFRLSMLFLFRGGDFFKIEWAETGLGRASSNKEEAVGMKCKFNIEPRVIYYR